MKPVVLEWELEVAASPEHAWKVFSDTDRFNRNAGLNFSFKEVPREDGGVDRFGELWRYGLHVQWLEERFDFESPNWLRNVRVMQGGPLERLEVDLDVEAKGSGSLVRYVIRMVPRNFLARPIVMADANFSTQPTVDAALHNSKAIAEGNVPDFGPAPSPLSSDQLLRVKEAAEQVTPFALGNLIGEVVAGAPESEQARIQALELGERLGLEPTEAIRGCLEAVRHGLLEMYWELLCPSCFGPKSSLETFDGEAKEVHCPSCNIQYDGSFPDSVAAVFRTSREIRTVQAAVDCVLSPQRTPHVLARKVLDSAKRTRWRAKLPAGGFQIDTIPSRGAASLRVREGVRANEVTVDVTAKGLRPAILEVGPGPVTIHLRNRMRNAVEVTLKRRKNPPHTLTAGMLFEDVDLALLVPMASVAPGVKTTIARGTVVAVEVRTHDHKTRLSSLKRSITESGLKLSYSGSNTLITSWTSEAKALQLAASLDGEKGIAVGIAVGPVAEIVNQIGAHFPAGGTVDTALAVMRATKTERVGLDVESLDDERVFTALSDLGKDVAMGKRSKIGVVQLVFRSGVERRKRRAEEEEAKPSPNRVLIGGRYEVRGEIGRGGMGLVYEVLDTQTKQLVVVKMMLPACSTDPAAVQRFYNEARISLAMKHANIVSVTDYGEDQGRPFLVMERLFGEELLERLGRDGKLDDAMVRDVGVGVLNALEVAHNAGIVHRDLKPENIFLIEDQQGVAQVKLIDFGIAQAMDEEDELAKQGILVGSLDYISPEQANLDALDGRSDLYSLGLVLWQCVVGDVPFKASTHIDLVMKRVQNRPEAVAKRAGRDVDPMVAAVIERATQIAADDRYTDAARMRDALGEG